MAAAPRKSPKRARGTRRARWLAGIGIGLPLATLLLWAFVHRVPWLGPLLANGLRATVGTTAVAKLEDFAYSVEDRFNRFWRKGEPPKTYWQVPKTPPPPVHEPAPGEPPAVAAFSPQNIGPMHKSWSAPGDGVWLPIKDPRRPGEPPYLWKTLLHPDPNRSWAELFVVAVGLRRTRLHVMAGSSEPKSIERPAQSYKRIAHVPEAQHDDLLAAFNGGFMAEHGYYGMKIDDVVLVKPRDHACTIAAYAGDTLRISSWSALSDSEKDMLWYRQAPACMYEDGKIHPGLVAGSSAKWGATLDGETVIRRSAIGLNRDRDVLYVAISNHTSARAIATGMFHAGATDIAQLDVNWSYPKFVLFEPSEPGGPRKAVPLAPGFEFSEDEYIRKRSIRDFFYLMRKPDSEDAQN